MIPSLPRLPLNLRERGKQMPIEGDRRRDVALFRFALVREAADPQLSPRRRGELVRAIASQDHLGPDGTRLRVSRPSIDRWIRAWRRGGFAGLYPKPRKGILRTPEDVLALAERLKKENPRRTAAQVRAILLRLDVEAPSERTLQRHFARLGLYRGGAKGPQRSYGRFEAGAPGDLWTGDVLHGPVVAERKTYLFAFIDDFSRALMGYRFGLAEDAVRLEAALRAGLAARGIPKALYVVGVDIRSLPRKRPATSPDEVLRESLTLEAETSNLRYYFTFQGFEKVCGGISRPSSGPGGGARHRSDAA